MTQIHQEVTGLSNTPPLASTASVHIANLAKSGLIVDAYQLHFTNSGGAFVAADIDDIVLDYNGKSIVDVTGAQLRTINAYYSLTTDAEYLDISFVDRNARTPDAQRMGSLNLIDAPAKSLTLKIGVDGTQTGTCTLQVFEISNERPKTRLPDGKGGSQPNTWVRAYLSAVQAVAASTEDLTVPRGDVRLPNQIRGVHVFNSNMTHAELMKDRRKIRELQPIGVTQYWAEQVKRTVQSGHYCFDMIPDGVLAEALDPLRADSTESDLKFRGTFSGAENINIVTDVLLQHPALA